MVDLVSEPEEHRTERVSRERAVMRLSSSPEERGAKPAALDDGTEQWHNLKIVPGNSSGITVDGRARGAFRLCPEARPILRALAMPCWRSRARA
jgi:hypothetical protein